MNIINRIAIFLILYLMITNSIAFLKYPDEYKEISQGFAKFDISQPIDSTGFKLNGFHLEGGKSTIEAKDTELFPFLSFENGEIQLPTSESLIKAPYIKTDLSYFAIKIQQSNLFIKAGLADRYQEVSNLDPSILEDGYYHWKVPFFSFGIQTPQSKSIMDIHQFTLIGGVEKNNAMYTKQIEIVSHGKITGSHFISKQQTSLLNQFWTQYFGYGVINWNAFGDTNSVSHGRGGKIQAISSAIGHLIGLSFIKGFIKLPTLQTYWSAPKNEIGNCPNILKGCVIASIASNIEYHAIKISIPLFSNIEIFGESGTGLRQLIPTNLRMDRNSNVYIRKIISPKLNLYEKYKSGSYKAPFFAVGIKLPLNKVIALLFEYDFFPLNENSNRLAWRDAPNAHLFFYGLEVHKKIVGNLK